MARSVAVTGASTGIGEACALYLDAKGWRVFAGVRRQSDGDALRAKASERLTPLLIDVADDSSVIAAAKVVAADTPKLDGLVNNAGIIVSGPLEFVPLEDFRTQFDVNVTGLVAVTQAFMPLIRAATGRIVNIGSVGGKLTVPFAGPYSASKHAVEALSDALRLELAPWKIHVALIEPAAVATPIWEKGAQAARTMIDRLPQAAKDLYGRVIPAMFKRAEEEARIGVAPVEVAKRVEHALSSSKPKTRYVLGPQAQIRVRLRYLPDRLRDKVISSQLKLPK